MTLPEMTRWQCDFLFGASHMRWVVMAFGEESARAKAVKYAAAWGKGWKIGSVTQIKEEAA